MTESAPFFCAFYPGRSEKSFAPKKKLKNNFLVFLK